MAMVQTVRADSSFEYESILEEVQLEYLASLSSALDQAEQPIDMEWLVRVLDHKTRIDTAFKGLTEIISSAS